MAANINFSKYIPNALNLKLPTFEAKPSLFRPSISNSSGKFLPATFSTPTGSPFLRILAYLFAIFVVIIVILLFVHYFITPVFKTRPGSPGIIPVPGGDDGKLYWNKGTTGIIDDKNTPINGIYYGYSLILDVFIQNPLQFSTHPRMIYSRGGMLKDKPTSDTMIGMYQYYNMGIGLLPDTNDLLVSVLNNNNNMETVVVQNVPVQEPFRVGVILMENALEVYLNGKLVKTRPLVVAPADVKGSIFGPSGSDTTTFKVRNLKIWNRILTTNEMKYATPALSSITDFNPSPMSPSSNTSNCPSVTQAENRLSKLLP
jgi:hypothetical protein